MVQRNSVGNRLIQALAVVALLVGSIRAPASTLSDVAAAMPAGSWAELTGMAGWNSGGILNPLNVTGCRTGDYITQFAEKAAWDPVGRRVLFIGQTHGDCYAGRFVILSEVTNGWTQGPWPPGICQSGTASNPCFSHAYDHNTVDPTTGDMYFRQAFTSKFFRFRNGAWTTIPQPSAGGFQCCGALEYFPDLGRLIFIDGDWGVWAYNPTTNGWTALANTNVSNAVAGVPNLPMISYNNFAIYNPVHKILLFGGGTSRLYKMSANGTIATLRAPPFELAVTRSVISVDPVTGHFIVLSGASMHQYDVTTDTWQQVATTVPATLRELNGVGDGLIQAPITSYGVVMYIKYFNSESKVYLYKHSPSAPPPPRPMPPTQIAVQ